MLKKKKKEKERKSENLARHEVNEEVTRRKWPDCCCLRSPQTQFTQKCRQLDLDVLQD